MGTRLMLNLRENFYNPQGRLPGADTAITSLAEMSFGGDGSRRGQGGRVQEFASRGSRDCRTGPCTPRGDRGATIESGIEIQLHSLGAQRRETEWC